MTSPNSIYKYIENKYGSFIDKKIVIEKPYMEVVGDLYSKYTSSDVNMCFKITNMDNMTIIESLN